MPKIYCNSHFSFNSNINYNSHINCDSHISCNFQINCDSHINCYSENIFKLQASYYTKGDYKTKKLPKLHIISNYQTSLLGKVCELQVGLCKKTARKFQTIENFEKYEILSPTKEIYMCKDCLKKYYEIRQSNQLY